MNFDFAIGSRTWESAVVVASIFQVSILNDQDSLSSISKYFVSSCFNDLFIPFVPSYFCSRLGDLTNQFYSICFTNLNVGKIFCKDSFFFCKKNFLKNKLNWRFFFPQLIYFCRERLHSYPELSACQKFLLFLLHRNILLHHPVDIC